MHTNNKTAEIDMKIKLSTLWIFATLNYLYCDVVTLFDPRIQKRILAGNVNGIHFTQGFLLGVSLLMEIPIVMVLLSRVLTYRANRCANIISGAVMTVVQFLSQFAGTPTLYSIFFSIIEIASTSFIVWYAWKWPKPEGA